MSDPTFTYTLEVTVNAGDRPHATARERADAEISLWLKAAGYRTRILSVAEGSERTWGDDCADADGNGRGPDRDDNRKITEAEIARGYPSVEERARREPLPHALRRDVLGGGR